MVYLQSFFKLLLYVYVYFIGPPCIGLRFISEKTQVGLVTHLGWITLGLILAHKQLSKCSAYKNYHYLRQGGYVFARFC